MSYTENRKLFMDLLNAVGNESKLHLALGHTLINNPMTRGFVTRDHAEDVTLGELLAGFIHCEFFDCLDGECRKNRSGEYHFYNKDDSLVCTVLFYEERIDFVLSTTSSVGFIRIDDKAWERRRNKNEVVASFSCDKNYKYAEGELISEGMVVAEGNMIRLKFSRTALEYDMTYAEHGLDAVAVGAKDEYSVVHTSISTVVRTPDKIYVLMFKDGRMIDSVIKSNQRHVGYDNDWTDAPVPTLAEVTALCEVKETPTEETTELTGQEKVIRSLLDKLYESSPVEYAYALKELPADIKKNIITETDYDQVMIAALNDKTLYTELFGQPYPNIKDVL